MYRDWKSKKVKLQITWKILDSALMGSLSLNKCTSKKQGLLSACKSDVFQISL